VVEREREAWRRHLTKSSSSVFGPGKLGKGTRNRDVFMVGWLVAPPPDRCLDLLVRVDRLVNRTESVRKRKTAEIEIEWENPSVTLTNS